MKHYDNKELDTKIHTFLDRKFEQYPELVLPRRGATVIARPNFGGRIANTLVSGRHFTTV